MSFLFSKTERCLIWKITGFSSLHLPMVHKWHIFFIIYRKHQISCLLYHVFCCMWTLTLLCDIKPVLSAKKVDRCSTQYTIKPNILSQYCVFINGLKYFFSEKSHKNNTKHNFKCDWNRLIHFILYYFPFLWFFLYFIFLTQL